MFTIPNFMIKTNEESNYETEGTTNFKFKASFRNITRTKKHKTKQSIYTNMCMAAINNNQVL